LIFLSTFLSVQNNCKKNLFLHCTADDVFVGLAQWNYMYQEYYYILYIRNYMVLLSLLVGLDLDSIGQQAEDVFGGR
jgi:hypothetical protein